MRKRFGSLAHPFQRAIPVAQLLATAAILAWVPGNAAKLLAMLIVWAIGFGRVTRTELALMACVNAVFIAMDVATVRQGAFLFSSPDLLGLPYYEFLIWGFYVLNTIRFLGAKAPQGSVAPVIGLVVLFALPFALIHDYHLLFLATAIVLAIGIGFFHQRRDLAFIGAMIATGAIIEYTGVHSGQWAYDGPTAGGVPLWFMTMWGGVGLFIHRLALPLLRRLDQLGVARRIDAERIQ